MKATKNIHHIDIDASEAWEINLGGKKLFFDPEFIPENHSIQHGIVRNPAMTIPNQPNMAQPCSGDTVYFHHHVEGNTIDFLEDHFRWATQSQLYFVLKNEEIIMMNDFILIKPVVESEEDLKVGDIVIKSSADKIKQRGIVVALTPQAEEAGIKVGQEITYTKNSDYIFDFQGDDYYMMEWMDIVGYYEDEELIPVGQWSLVKPLDEEDEYKKTSTGIFLQTKQVKSKKHRGRIHKTNNVWLGIKDGDKVIYDRKAFFAVKEKEEKLYAVNAERDIFMISYEE